jgi:hypothetical protein
MWRDWFTRRWFGVKSDRMCLETKRKEQENNGQATRTLHTEMPAPHISPAFP